MSDIFVAYSAKFRADVVRQMRHATSHSPELYMSRERLPARAPQVRVCAARAKKGAKENIDVVKDVNEKKFRDAENPSNKSFPHIT